MEMQVNASKSAMAQDQMPIQPPSYPGPPQYDAAEYSGNATVQPGSAPPMLLVGTLGIEPVAMVCSACNERIVTRIERSVWFRTHIIAGILCLMGLIAACLKSMIYVIGCNNDVPSYCTANNNYPEGYRCVFDHKCVNYGCWCCVPIPYCTDVCKKAVHYCPKCNAYIGTQL